MADAESRPGPDLMNDPQYATNTRGDEGTGDADTCRICRGETTELEPLFYPCKCSGSIKFVHQDCLMEWLSHSQKKHCELCKTPFRFTKLYAPNMPQTLPAYVFARHLIIHTLKNLAVWLRFCLVVFVWLGCLPWAMRHIWGFLFWFGDGGWTTKDLGSPSVYDAPTQKAFELAHEQLVQLVGNGTSPASPWLIMPTTSAKLGMMTSMLPTLLNPFSHTLNMSAPDSITSSLFKPLLHTLGLHGTLSTETFNNTASTTQTLASHPPGTANRPSLLSDVKFLRTLTRYPQINSIIVTTLEGQIITVVVVMCFILVFLIREWVVQQQPGINMGAGFNAELAGAERPARNRDLQLDNQPDAERFRADRFPGDIVDPQEAGGRREVAGRPVARPIARPRRRVVRFEDGQGNDLEQANEGGRVHESTASNTGRFREEMGESSSSDSRDQRHDTLVRDGLSSAIQIQHVADENSSENRDKSDAAEFVSLWRRAGGNPEEVLRIIEAEGLGEKLQYWKNAMKGLQHPNRVPESPSNDCPSPGGVGSLYSSSGSLTVQPSDSTNSNKDNWVDIPRQESTHNPSSSGLFHLERPTSDAPSKKGKEKFDGSASETPLDSPRSSHSRSDTPKLNVEGDEEVVWKPITDSRSTSSFRPGPGRQRSISDGPKLQENISPLASNNWSFPDPTSTAKTPDTISGLEEHPWKVEQGLYPQETSLDSHATQIASQAGSSQGVMPVEAPNADASQDFVGPIEIYSVQKDTTQHFQSWDEAFASNPLSDSEDDFEETAAQEGGPEQNPFHPEGVLPGNIPPIEAREPIPAPRQEPQGLLGHIADWLWGDMNMRREGRVIDDEHVVQDIAAEAPFVPVAHHGHGVFDDNDSDAGGEDNQDPQVVAAALAAGIDPNDPDGLDDAEDFEGIMELVGMRGPLTALVQNGLFSVFLISLTVACGVWVPYNVGRLVLLLLANPIATVKLPLKLVFSCAAVVQDLTLVLLGSISFFFLKLCLLPTALYSYTTDGPAISKMIMDRGLAWDCMRIAYLAGERILDGLFNALVHIPESEVPAFSAVSHESLIHIKTIISSTFQYIGASVTSLLASSAAESALPNDSIDAAAAYATFLRLVDQISQVLTTLPASLVTAESWVITLDIPGRSTPLDPSLSYWNGTDRFWAILAGYVAFSFLGAAYLRKGSTFSTSQTGKEWEATIIDVLHQAGGVMKVILIISIEMLVFPLYCGLLLDLALLPLFENATILSRTLFTIETPLTSVFIHWFVGTCYMFHFALFVSMCRKIMRSGVLYFIRDPDDPTFHPVRDVLERNVATQLRKITFSAMVYGALVVICLGGVVWSLAFAFKGVLPIHWSSNEPVLEFPIDLLFYNFFMPLAVKFFKPSDGLHAMYSWWFRKCARMLRLTWFLFDERMADEEGRFVGESLPGSFWGAKTATMKPQESTDKNVQFIQDGRYVRAPASDQVRIPKGGTVFLEVSENNDRIDGLQDQDDDLRGRNSELFKMVYVPPNFRLRIFLFILFIWIFAAVTGVSITIVPLVFGRHVFTKIIPSHVRKNDIYAFSIGIYILGSALYCMMHLQQGLDYLRRALAVDASTPAKVLRKVSSISLRILRIFYAYAAFALILPTLFALAVEFYFIVPLHTYFAVDEPHIIHFVQSWTLGLLYVKLATRFILWHSGSRPAEALRAITRNGYLDPDIRIATRAFIFPATIVLLASLLIPLAIASLANRYNIFGADPAQQTIVYRYAYPLCLSFMLNMTALWLFLGVMKGWRMRIRDEVYLIGERLHNFGDRSKSSTASLIPTGTRLET